MRAQQLETMRILGHICAKVQETEYDDVAVEFIHLGDKGSYSWHAPGSVDVEASLCLGVDDHHLQVTTFTP